MFKENITPSEYPQQQKIIQEHQSSIGGQQQSQKQQQIIPTKNLSKIRFDTIKNQDLKTLFEILMIEHQNRTIADLDSILKILMNIQPIKKQNNSSSIFMMGRKMNIKKYKAKQFIFETNQKSEHFYIIMNGKVALFKTANQYFDSDEVVFLMGGSCFGKVYQNRNKFMGIAVEETLVAVFNQRDNNMIPMQLSSDKQRIYKELSRTDLLGGKNYQKNYEKLMEVGQYLSLNVLPLGSFLIREGQIPRALFYISKGLVKKSFSLTKTPMKTMNSTNFSQDPHQLSQIQTNRYSQGDFCPKCIKQPLLYDLVTESICQIITIPKKALKILNSTILNAQSQILTSQFFLKQLESKKKWKQHRENVLKQVIQGNKNSKKGFQFRG